VDQWLIPEVVQGYKIWSGQEKPYQKEQEYIKSLQSK
jgi:hypothetical protein